jgi:hypothetical protein
MYQEDVMIINIYVSYFDSLNFITKILLVTCPDSITVGHFNTLSSQQINHPNKTSVKIFRIKTHHRSNGLNRYL